MSTLVVHAGGIGDFILCAPALAALAAEGPVELAGNRDRCALGVAMGVARAAHDLDGVGFHTVFSRPSPRLAGFLGHFDRAVVWMRDDDNAIVRGFRKCGVRDVRCFPGLPPAGWTRHASEYYTGCLGAPHGPTPRVNVPIQSGPEVIVHPGSGAAHKNWPPPNFEAVLAAPGLRDRAAGWCMGPAEENIEPPAGCTALRHGSLIELAGVLAGARLYLGNDSGITHLAAAVGARVVAVFGPTDPTVWRPTGARVRAVRGVPWPGHAAGARAARDGLSMVP